jgi:hypothetical protein
VRSLRRTQTLKNVASGGRSCIFEPFTLPRNGEDWDARSLYCQRAANPRAIRKSINTKAWHRKGSNPGIRHYMSFYSWDLMASSISS